MNNNNFQNEALDSTISNLKSLELFYLQNNFIIGSIPESIGDLVLLKSLNFSNNNFKGRLLSNYIFYILLILIFLFIFILL
jgi:Leucine-rich repeat (LRR) protein